MSRPSPRQVAARGLLVVGFVAAFAVASRPDAASRAEPARAAAAPAFPPVAALREPAALPALREPSRRAKRPRRPVARAVAPSRPRRPVATAVAAARERAATAVTPTPTIAAAPTPPPRPPVPAPPVRRPQKSPAPASEFDSSGGFESSG